MLPNRRSLVIAAMAAPIAAPGAAAAQALSKKDYYEDSADGCDAMGAPTVICVMTFTKLPAGAPVIIRRVSCYLSHRDPMRRIEFGEAGPTAFSLERRTIVPWPGAQSSSNDVLFSSINQEVLFRVAGKAQPRILILYPTTASHLVARCTIAGAPATP